MANQNTAHSVALIVSDPTTGVFLHDNLTADGWQVTTIAADSDIEAARSATAIVSVDRITAASPHLRGVPILLLDPGDGRTAMLVDDTDAPIVVCRVPFSYPELRKTLKALANT